MEDITTLLARWQITSADAREQIYRAKTPRERERWHARLFALARMARRGGWPKHSSAIPIPLATGSPLLLRTGHQPWPSSKVVAPPRPPT
jgi:hypothetical protein